MQSDFGANVGYFGRIDKANSDAPSQQSSSFYSNNTSVISTQGLNNSRYHVGEISRKDRIPPQSNVGKVIPQMNKSSEGLVPNNMPNGRVTNINKMNQSIGAYSQASH